MKYKLGDIITTEADGKRVTFKRIYSHPFFGWEIIKMVDIDDPSS